MVHYSVLIPSGMQRRPIGRQLPQLCQVLDAPDPALRDHLHRRRVDAPADGRRWSGLLHEFPPLRRAAIRSTARHERRAIGRHRRLARRPGDRAGCPGTPVRRHCFAQLDLAARRSTTWSSPRASDRLRDGSCEPLVATRRLLAGRSATARRRRLVLGRAARGRERAWPWRAARFASCRDWWPARISRLPADAGRRASRRAGRRTSPGSANGWRSAGSIGVSSRTWPASWCAATAILPQRLDRACRRGPASPCAAAGRGAGRQGPTRVGLNERFAPEHLPDTQARMKIFFSAGEPSGDLHGANLIRAVAAALPATSRPSATAGRKWPRPAASCTPT